jgi:hypothetical protein
MKSEYGQLKGKTEKETRTTTRQPEEDRVDNIEPEAKKLRVQTKDRTNLQQTRHGLLPPR